MPNVQTAITVVSTSDTTPPVLHSLSFPTTPLDTRTGPATLPVTISATDDISGLKSNGDWYVEVDFTSPSGNQKVQQVQRLPNQTVYVEFPQYAEAGTWRLSLVLLRDNAGNDHWYGSELESMPNVQTAIRVLGTTPPSSTTTTNGPGTTTTTQPSHRFPDVSDSYPYAPQIYGLVTRGIVLGYTTGLFGPEDRVLRQQFAKMIVLTLGLPVSESDISPFSDVDVSGASGLYPDNYVAVCAQEGITIGTGLGTFSPWSQISRAQIITMVGRAAGLPDPPASYVPPFGDFSPDHYPWARRAAYADLLQGLQGVGPSWNFWQPATRGEVAAVLYNLLHR